MIDLDDPIAKRERQEAEAFMCNSSENMPFAKPEQLGPSKKEMCDLLSVLDTVETKLKKKYKE